MTRSKEKTRLSEEAKELAKPLEMEKIDAETDDDTETETTVKTPPLEK